MAAVTELSFLLFALINNIYAEERIIIQKERTSYTFNLPNNTNSCLISRFIGEEKLVLWNTSDLCSNNSSLPETLKQRLVSTVNTSSYTILHLTHSDSGPYQEECWTDGIVTHENNITITVCTSMVWRVRGARVGQTVEVPCDGAADNLDVQWLKRVSRYEQETWSRISGDNAASVMDNVRGRYQMVANTSVLSVSLLNNTIDVTQYRCLAMNQQQCVSSHTVQLVSYEVVYGSVGEIAVLQCTSTDPTDDQPLRWVKVINKTLSITNLGQQNQTVPSVNQNYSLVFSSLMLNHSGWYFCEASVREQDYLLVVCPKFGPPAVKLFSEGEVVTLRCRDWREDKVHDWFIKSNRTEGRIFSIDSDHSISRVSWNYDNGSLVISNISVGDAGEYWCTITDPYDDYHCVSTVRTLLVYNEPFGIYSTFFKVRCSVFSVLLLMLCVAVVAVNLRTQRGAQLSAHIHT